MIDSNIKLAVLHRARQVAKQLNASDNNCNYRQKKEQSHSAFMQSTLQKIKCTFLTLK